MQYSEAISNFAIKIKDLIQGNNNQISQGSNNQTKALTEKKVFLSYSRKDKEQILAVQEFLEDEGIVVWRDEKDIYGGQTFYKEIAEAIKDHDYLVVFWSKDASESRHVEYEWSGALYKDKIIIPYLLDATPLSLFLAVREYVESPGQLLKALDGLDRHRKPQTRNIEKTELADETNLDDLGKVEFDNLLESLRGEWRNDRIPKSVLAAMAATFIGILILSLIIPRVGGSHFNITINPLESDSLCSNIYIEMVENASRMAGLGKMGFFDFNFGEEKILNQVKDRAIISSRVVNTLCQRKIQSEIPDSVLVKNLALALQPELWINVQITKSEIESSLITQLEYRKIKPLLNIFLENKLLNSTLLEELEKNLTAFTDTLRLKTPAHGWRFVLAKQYNFIGIPIPIELDTIDLSKIEVKIDKLRQLLYHIEDSTRHDTLNNHFRKIELLLANTYNIFSNLQDESEMLAARTSIVDMGDQIDIVLTMPVFTDTPEPDSSIISQLTASIKNVRKDLKSIQDLLNLPNHQNKSSSIELHFAKNEFVLTDALKTFLDEQFLKYKDEIQKYKFEVIGYASKEGFVTSNRRLSTERAITIKNYLAQYHGVSRENVLWHGVGQSVLEPTLEGNRKVVIKIVRME